MPPDDDAKVRGEVVAVLFDGHVKELRKSGQWCAIWRRHRSRSRRLAALPRRRAVAARRCDTGSSLRTKGVGNPVRALHHSDTSTEHFRVLSR